MGEVYAATHAPSDLPVAFKLVRSDLISPTSLAEFEAEIRAQARIDHPGVVYLFDHGRLPPTVAHRVGMPAGAPWLAMEHCSSSLREIAGGLAWRGIRDVLLQLLDALAHAHAVGVLHRDIKLSNVLVSTADDLRPGVKLADFGVAHALADDDEVTRAIGTPRYMAPEQVRGTWEAHGPWTDLYALGVLAWRLVTGRRPWPKLQGMMLARAMCESPLGWPGARLPIPVGLRDWIEKMTAKAPWKRFQLAADAASALRQLPVDTALQREPHRIGTLIPTQDQTKEVPRPRAPVISPQDDPPAESEAAIRLRHAGLGMLPLRRPAFIGRRHERRVAWETLRRVAQRGEARALCVVGAPRVGRTRFLQWLGEAAERVGQAVTVSIRATEGRTFDASTLAALRAWFRVGALEHDRLRAHLASWMGEGPWLDDFAALLRLGHAADAGWLGTVAAGLAALGRLRPVILRIEGAAWEQEASLLAQAVLAEPHAPVMVVVDAALPGLPTLELGPLEAPAMHRLAMAYLGLEPDVRSRLVERAAGSPGFLVMTLVHWCSTGRLRQGPHGFVVDDESALPPSLDLVATVRLHAVAAALPEGGLESLERALVLGDPFALDDWAGVDGPGREDLRAEVVRVLADRGLLEGHAGAYAVPSVPFREAVLREAGDRLDAHHARCAAWLAEKASARHLELGQHLLASGRIEEALVPLYRGLVQHIEQRGGAASLSVARSLEDAVARLPGPDRIVWQARVDEVRSGMLLAAGETGEAEERARAALRTGETFGDRDLTARAWARLGAVAGRRGDEEERGRCLERALELQQAVDTATVSTWWMELAKAHLTRGHRARWADCMRAASTAAEGDDRVRHVGALGRAAARQVEGRIEGALACLDEAEVAAGQAGSGLARLAVARARGHTLLAMGERRSARESFQAALDLALAVRPARVAVVLANLVALDLALGDPRQAIDRYRRHAFVLPPGQDGGERLVPAHCAALVVEVLERDWRRVDYHFERIRRHGSWGWAGLEANARLLLAASERLRDEGRGDQAVRVARAALERCGALQGQRVHARLRILAIERGR